MGLTPYYKWTCFVFNEVRSAISFAVDAGSLWYGLLQLNRKISFNARHNGFISFLVEDLRLRHTKMNSNMLWEIDHEIHPCPTSQICKKSIIYIRMTEKTWAGNTERVLYTEYYCSQLKSVPSTSTFRQILSFTCIASQLLIKDFLIYLKISPNQSITIYYDSLCWGFKKSELLCFAFSMKTYLVKIVLCYLEYQDISLNYQQ